MLATARCSTLLLRCSCSAVWLFAAAACSFDTRPAPGGVRPRLAATDSRSDQSFPEPSDDWTTQSGAMLAQAQPSGHPAAACQAQCKDRACGSDGCGGSCGSCGAKDKCDATFQCRAKTKTKTKTKKEAEAQAEPKPDCDRGGACPCTRDCAGHVCGDDGCGGSCGTCPMAAMCGADGICLGPVCGNGIIEPGEQCDGGDQCGSDCKKPLAQTDLQRCVTFAATDAEDPCQQCVCNHCTQQALDCYSSGNVARDDGCRGLAECGNRHGCYDFSCYCGDSLLCLVPNGSCRAETERAVGSREVNSVLQCYDDPECATYRAHALGECLVRDCSDVCGP
jgi:hypothetical protein